MGPTRRPSYSISRFCTSRRSFSARSETVPCEGRSHDQHELFAAIARDDILAPRSGQHVLAYRTQHRIPAAWPSVSLKR